MTVETSLQGFFGLQDGGRAFPGGIQSFVNKY